MVNTSDAAHEPLSDEREAMLLHLQEISGSLGRDEAKRLLETCHWNIEVAVNRILGTEEEGGSVRRRRPLTPQVDLVPSNQRIIRAPITQYRTWYWPLFLFIEPFRITYHILTSVVQFLVAILWPGSRNEVTDPVGDVRRFIDNFKSTYAKAKLPLDTSHVSQPVVAPPFYEGSYSQALREARDSLRFLIVYLHGDSHEDTPGFCQNTLLDDDVLQFFNNSERIILWGCNINAPEGYHVSRTLREHTYPFIGVIGLAHVPSPDAGNYSVNTTRMALLGRIEGGVTPVDLIQQLSSILSDNEAAIVAAQLDRQEREATAQIREEQNKAYAESLANDQAKREAQLEADRNAVLREEERKEMALRESKLIQARALRCARWQRCLPPPPESSTPDTVKLSIKLPNGTRVSRVFSLHDSIKILYYFVLSQKDAPDNFDVQSNFPRRVVPCKPDDESDLEDYIEIEENFTEHFNGSSEGNTLTKSCDISDDDVLSKIVLDWLPKGEQDPPSFYDFGLHKAEALFIIDNDA